VLNIAYNLLAGGMRLEHLELRRNDEVYTKALGAARIAQSERIAHGPTKIAIG
jgi:hypothetical protein